jgi:hypothetical protein
MQVASFLGRFRPLVQKLLGEQEHMHALPNLTGQRLRELKEKGKVLEGACQVIPASGWTTAGNPLEDWLIEQ